MKLSDLLDKSQQVQVTIFQTILNSEGIVSIKQLMKEMDVSLPTLQKEIKELQLSVHYFDKSSRLVRIDNDSLTLHLSTSFSVQNFIYNYLEQALDYQILTFIYRHKETSVTKMALDLQVSEASIFRRLKEINQSLAEFSIQFRNKKIIGEEIQIRIFFFQLFWQSLPPTVLQKRFNQPVIAHLIRVIETHVGLAFSNEQYWKLSLWFCIMQNRMDYRGKQVYHLENEMMIAIENDPFYQELKNILARFLSRSAFQWSEEEAMYFYLFFLSEVLVEADEKLFTKSQFLVKFLAVNQQIFQTIVDSEAGIEPFNSALLKSHLQVSFTKGWIETNHVGGMLLSDMHSEKMSACMTIIEKNLAKISADSQWHMLDQIYGLIALSYKRRQQRKVVVGVALDKTLESEESYRFIQEQLSAVPYVKIRRDKNREYSLLIATEYTDLSDYAYQKIYLLSGQTSKFEAKRLKKAIQELLKDEEVEIV